MPTRRFPSKPPDYDESRKVEVKLSIKAKRFVQKVLGNQLICRPRFAWLCSYPYDMIKADVRKEIYDEAIRLDCQAFIPFDNQVAEGID